MKFLLFLSLVLFSSLASARGLKDFFGTLEGTWNMIDLQEWHEDGHGSVETRNASSFRATVLRSENKWKFSESVCWNTVSSCESTELAYAVNGDALTVEIGGDTFPVDVLELGDDFLTIQLRTTDSVLFATIEITEHGIEQNSSIEMNDGSKIVQVLHLSKLSKL